MVPAYKIMLLGDIGVGKTSIARRLVFKTFDTNYKATLGVDIYTHRMTLSARGEEVAVELAIWDIDGDFGPGIFKHIYIKGASAALVLADVTRASTVESAKNLVHLFQETLPGRPVLFILNKTDLDPGAQIETMHDLERLGVEPILASAKSGANVQASFEALTLLCLEREL